MDFGERTKPESNYKYIHSFDASKSVDKKGAECIRFKFDFGDGSNIKESKHSKVTHQFTAEGTYLVTFVVMDSGGNRSSAPLTHKIERVKESKESDGGKSKKKRKQRKNQQKKHEDEEDTNGSEGPSTGSSTHTTDRVMGSPNFEGRNRKRNTASHGHKKDRTYLVTVVVMDSDENRSCASLSHNVEKVVYSQGSNGEKSVEKRNLMKRH